MTSLTDHSPSGSRPQTWPGRVLRWWLGELRGAYDDLTRHLSAGRRGMVTVEAGERYWILRQRQRPIGQIDWQSGGAEECRLALRSAFPAEPQPAPVLVEIPPERVLSKTVTFPAAARGRLDRVLEFEIGRHFPFPADRVFFRHRVVERNATAGGPSQSIAVEIAVVPREIVADICRELAMAGLRAGGIALMTGGHTDPIFLPSTVLTGLQEAAQPEGNRLLFAAIGGLAVVAAISWPMAQQARLSSIESELALLKPQAEAALRAREQQQREAERAASVSTLATGRLPLIRALDTLSREIPDGSWLLSLSISGRDVVLDGLSPSAATIAQALERSRAFSAIDFRSPINRDATTGLEHFQLGATLIETKP
jgi:general secretion pathway protein L